MRFGKDIFLATLVLGVALFASCVDHASDNAEEIEQLRLDSIIQADADNALIDAYIADVNNDIDAGKVVELDYGVRYIVWDPAVSVRTPAFNDIVSVHYTGKFLSNSIFDTTDPKRAKRSDSLRYAAEGISFNDLIAAQGDSFEVVLDSLNTSDGAIEDFLFDLDRLYLPLTFNHREDGSGISFSFIFGFRSGLREVMLNMELNSKGLIIIPSAVAYGTLGTLDAAGEEAIPPNTPLLFEFDLVNIRP